MQQKCLMRKNGEFGKASGLLSRITPYEFPPNKLRFRVSSINAVLFRLDPGLKLCDRQLKAAAFDFT